LIYRVLYENPKKYTMSELQDFCAPEAIFSSDDNRKRFRDTLRFWSTSPHQLWSTDSEKKLFLDLPTPLEGFSVSVVAHQLRHRLMEIDFSDILSREDEFGASKAIRSFAYILTQDDFSIFHNALTRRKIDASFASNFGLYSLNDSEKPFFMEFCNFLGISEKVGTDDYLDPTRLLSSFVSKIFEERQELGAAEFIQRLARFVPILDNGKYNLVVREVIGAEIDMPNFLSINLSHALNRLNEKRVLQFSTKSDDVDAVVLNFPNGIRRQISSIAYLRGVQ